MQKLAAISLILIYSVWADSPTALNIDIIDGDGAVNNIRQRTAREPIVEVTDENHKPVAGALVLFSAPDHGASGVFANGSRQISVTTNAQGRAAGQGFQPNLEKGRVEIQVQASYQGVHAATYIHSINVAHVMSPVAKWTIIGGVLAGAAVGFAVGATAGGGSGSSKSTVITPGAPAITGPH